jgi:hypothetical protein
MGFKNSPYNTGLLFAEEYIRGEPGNPDNIFRWDVVKLNLPGDPDYVPWLPWVMKWRFEDDKIACDFIVYVDDARSAGNLWEEARLAARSIASKLNWLGIQDATRKRRDPSQTPGPWVGSFVFSDGEAISVAVSQERWDKAKEIINWIAESMTCSDSIDYKKLERHRGFLVYLVRTYPVMNPYLKGIHLTIDSWRPFHSKDGWKMTLSELNEAMKDKLNVNEESVQMARPAPRFVKWVPRLKEDIEALTRFLSSEPPPIEGW